VDKSTTQNYICEEKAFVMNKQKTLIGIIILVAILCISFISFSITGFFILEPENKVAIGFTIPLTGKASSYAIDMKAGAELALKELKSQENDNIYFIFEDTGAVVEKAVTSAQKLINFNEAKIIVAISSNEMLALAPITEEAKVILFTPIAGAEKITTAGDYVFRNRETASYSGRVMAQYLFKRGLRKISVFTANSENSITYSSALKSEFVLLGGKIIEEFEYAQTQTDFRTQILKIKNNVPDGIYVSAGLDTDAALITKQLAEQGYDGLIIGATNFESKNFAESVNSVKNELIFTSPKFDPINKDINYFSNSFLEEYGGLPNAWAANGYDMIMLLSDAVTKCFDDTDCIKNYLYSVKDYNGVSGKFSFDEFGDVEKEVGIKTIKDGKFVPLKIN
jgi:branched-chain amino acid transport system substrate-binding protein